ncbi:MULTISPECIES: redoxin domain-containing protein [unclassified Kribbella]|uniref:redoxin domain-containing protein n=1 Tax=unclassified Kribbella TaxID=2644121 RepID=UPI0033F607EB
MLVQRFAVVSLTVLMLVLAGCAAPSPSSSGSPSPAGSAGSPPARPSTTAPATAAPAVPAILKFSGTTVDGKDFDGATLAAKPAVLWFWAPWCPKCRAQAAETAKVAEEYRGRANVVGVAGLDKPDAMRGFVADQKVGGFPHLSDENGEVWRRFEVTEQSTYVILDAAGNKVFSGNLVAGDGLAEKLSQLVG